MDARSVVRTKRDGGRLSEAEMRWFLQAYVRGEIADYQAAALVACIFTRGMEPDELVTWMRAMLESGSRLSFDEISQKKAGTESSRITCDTFPISPATTAANFPRRSIPCEVVA